MRGGLVGDDGPTHHGVFDLSYLRAIPNCVIAAPKDGDEFIDLIYTEILEIGKWEVLLEGEDILLLPVPSVVNARFLKPLDGELSNSLVEKHKFIFTSEDNVLNGGFGSAVLEFLADRGLLNGKTIVRFGIPARFITHGDKDFLLKEIGLDNESLKEKILQVLKLSHP